MNKFEDLLNVERPKISVITPSLNQGKFLRQMISTILSQTYRNFEQVVVDGGSTDETLKILNEFKHVRWISEKDNCMLEPFRKAFHLSRGEYIIQCCTSDGFVSTEWFERSVAILDSDPDISLVWGLPLNISEDGSVQSLAYSSLQQNPPPNRERFLPFWLATGFILPESNFCVRRSVFENCFPKIDDITHASRTNPLLAFNYNFNTQGFLPHFLPVVASYGRIHKGSYTETLSEIGLELGRQYFNKVRDYRKKCLKKKVNHLFRNGQGEVIGKASLNSWDCFKYRLKSSPWVKTDLLAFQRKIRKRLGSYLRKTI